MKKIEDIFRQQVLPAARKLRPERVIIGQKDHPARMETMVYSPDYIKKLSDRHVLPEFCVCLTGKCVVRIEGQGYLLTAGDFCFIGRNRNHFESYLQAKRDYEILWYLPHSLQRFVVQHSLYKGQEYRVLQSLHLQTTSDLVHRLDKISDENLPWPGLHRLIVCLVEEVESIVRQSVTKDLYSLAKKAQRKYHVNLMEQALQYILTHYAEKLSLKQVADMVRLNPMYFETLFHEMTGLTFLQQLTMTRLQRAHFLLNDSRMNIAEISQACGFHEYGAFSRVFRKHYGLSPRQFRNRYTPAQK
jgi:AraC-like DNA-binding protein